MVNWAGTMGKAMIGEWFWRFLAAVMLFAVGWAIWIFYQLNPPPLITSAAFEAAAKARANAGQKVQGVIAPAPAPEAPKEAEQEAPMAPSAGEPPINTERLKFSDSLTLPDRK